MPDTTWISPWIEKMSTVQRKLKQIHNKSKPRVRDTGKMSQNNAKKHHGST